MGGIDPQVNIRLRGTQLSACPALAGRYLSHRQDDAGFARERLIGELDAPWA